MCGLDAEACVHYEIEIEELKLQKSGLQRELNEVEQVLGKALGYPWYYHDSKNFPEATAADGVCVGDNTPASLADEASQEIDLLRMKIEDLEGQVG